MASLTRFSPFRELGRATPFQELEQMWRDMSRMWPMMGEGEAFGNIRLDITEEDKSYTVKADIPGVSKDDIKVSIEGDRVSIATEINRETEEKGQTSLCRERYSGQQYRSFTLGNPIDESQAVAKYENGVLELTLPKKGGATTRQLEIH